MRSGISAFVVFAVLALLPFVSAALPLQLGVSVDKSSYRTGESVSAFVDLENTSNASLTVSLNSVLGTNASADFPTMTDLQEVSLLPNESKRIEVFSFSVKEWFASATYYFDVQAFSETEHSEESASFKILGTSKPAVLNYSLCTDSLCSQKKRVFLKSEKVFLKTFSDAKTITSLSQYSTGIAQIPAIFPTILQTAVNTETGFTTSVLGNFQRLAGKAYSITMQNTGAGTLPETTSIDYAIIDHHPTIKNASKCNANNTCEPAFGESKKNCPQDCA